MIWVFRVVMFGVVIGLFWWFGENPPGPQDVYLPPGVQLVPVEAHSDGICPDQTLIGYDPDCN